MATQAATAPFALHFVSLEGDYRNLLARYFVDSPELIEYLVGQMLANSGTYDTLTLILEALQESLGSDLRSRRTSSESVEQWSRISSARDFAELFAELEKVRDDFPEALRNLLFNFKGCKLVGLDSDKPPFAVAQRLPQAVYAQFSETYAHIFMCAYAMLLGLE